VGAVRVLRGTGAARGAGGADPGDGSVLRRCR